ncbi:MAG TPA: hypothetical protein VGN61_06275 [Verrucomicrobiae bacterium]
MNDVFGVNRFAMSLFNTFARMIDEMPMLGIIGALQLERRMIEDDVIIEINVPLSHASLRLLL